MKLRNLLVAAVAAVFALWSCEDEKPSLGIEVSSNEVHIYQLGGGESIDVITSSTWTAIVPEAAQDWLTVYPPQGKGNTTVVFSAGENDGKERSATVQIKAGYDIVPVTVTQDGKIASGDGSKDNPFSASEARAWIMANLQSGQQSAESFYVRGKIHKMLKSNDVEQYYANNAQFGNASFFISDDGSASDNDFEAYRVKYLGNRAWKTGDTDVAVGDEVVIYGPLKLYNTTPENGDGAFLYSLNGVTEGGDEPVDKNEPQGAGTVTNPFNVAAAIDAVKNLTWTSNTEYDEVGPYFVAGKVVEIKENFDAVSEKDGKQYQYGNATFYIADEGYENTRFYCYRVKYFNNQAWQPGNTPLLEVGDYVVVCSKLMNYRGNTPETVSNSGYMICINDLVGTVVDPGTPGPGGDDVQPAGDGSLESPYNIAAAVSTVANLTWTSNTEYDKVGPYYVKGKVSDITQNFDASGDFGNATFNLVDVDGGSNKLACYRILYFNGQKYVAGQTPLPAVGSEVIVYSELMNYRGNTPETVANVGYVYSIDGVTEVGGETPPVQEETATGDGTLASPYNPKAAKDVASALEAGTKTEDVYVKGKISSIKYSFDAQHGTATFFISEDGTASGTQFQVYSTYYLGNRAWAEGDTQIALKDEVILFGKLTNFNGTPETSAKESCLYSLNGVTAGGETPPGPGGDDNPAGNGTVDNPYNIAAAASAVANLTWTSNTDYQKVGPYYVKGKVSDITQNFDASGDFGNATFNLVDVDGGAKLTCYRILYFKGEKYVAGQTPLPAVGSEVIVYSELMNYKGNTPETIANVGYVYSIGGVTEVGGGGETPPEPPVDETKTITEILALQSGVACDSKPSLVVALTARGFVATDGTKNVYVYTQGTNFGGIAKIGDMVKFSGVKGEYNGVPQVATITSVEVVSSNNNVTYPNPKDITESAGTYTATEAEYVSLTGTLTVSGNYYNLALDAFADGSKMGSIVFPVDDLNAGSFNGKKITVTGYFNGLSSQNKYINIIATKIEEVAAAEPVISNFQVSFYKFGISLSWDATEGATSYEWNLYNANGAKVARGITDQTAMRSNFSETAVSMENGFGVAWYTDSGSLNGKYLIFGNYSITLKANVPDYTNEVSKTLDLNYERDVLTVTKLVGTDTGFEAEWTPYTGEFSHYYWELHILGENNQLTRVITGCTTDPYVRNLPTETRYVDETHNTSWLTQDGMVQGAKYYFLVSALAPKQDPNENGNFLLAVSGGRDHFTFGATYEPVTITVDFKNKPCDDFPTGSANGVKQGAYMIGGYAFGFQASEKYYWNTDGFLLMGKAGSVILLPSLEGLALKKVTFKTGAGASEKVIVDIYAVQDDGMAKAMGINTTALSKGKEYAWDVPGEVGKSYALCVTNAYNAQFQYITLYYE